MKFILLMMLVFPSLGRCFTDNPSKNDLPYSIVIFLSQKSTPLNKIQEKFNIGSTCAENTERDSSRTPAVIEMYGLKRKINHMTRDN